jgi:hypothetical protein
VSKVGVVVTNKWLRSKSRRVSGRGSDGVGGGVGGSLEGCFGVAGQRKECLVPASKIGRVHVHVTNDKSICAAVGGKSEGEL